MTTLEKVQNVMRVSHTMQNSPCRINKKRPLADKCSARGFLLFCEIKSDYTLVIVNFNAVDLISLITGQLYLVFCEHIYRAYSLWSGFIGVLY